MTFENGILVDTVQVIGDKFDQFVTEIPMARISILGGIARFEVLYISIQLIILRFGHNQTW